MAMLEREDVARQQELLRTRRRTLAWALGQLAALGGYAHAPSGLLNDIEEHCVAIGLIKAWLRNAGVEVPDDLSDQAAQQLRALTSQYTLHAAGDTPLGTRVVLHRFSAGMGALRELIDRVPQIHDAAIEFRTTFQAACEQIETLRAYKMLHDQLHKVQFRCLEQIERELMRFPVLDDLGATLDEYAENLDQCIAKLHEVIAEVPTLKPAPTWILRLAQAHEQMVRALASHDVTLLRRATDQIRRILTLYPTPINAQLTSAVRMLRLATLVDVMSYIHTTCVTLHIDQTITDRIGTGLDALRELDTQLSVLSNTHDQWQPIDNLLRLLNDSQDDVADLWADLKEQAAPLYDGSTEPWAIQLQSNAVLLDQAVQLNDDRTIRQHFHNFRRRAMQQFYRVDEQLKKLCEKLDRVDGPFAFVIGVLE